MPGHKGGPLLDLGFVGEQVNEARHAILGSCLDAMLSCSFGVGIFLTN